MFLFILLFVNLFSIQFSCTKLKFVVYCLDNKIQPSVASKLVADFKVYRFLVGSCHCFSN